MMRRNGLGQIRKMQLNDLVTDEDYQRALRPKRVKEMIRNWDNAEFQPITINRRPGEAKYHVVDGQHRVEVIRAMPPNLAEDLKDGIWAVIHEGWSKEEEADYFWKAQRHRKALTLNEEFRAQLLAGIPEAVDIQATVRTLGYEVGMSDSPHGRNVRSIAALQDIYRSIGADGLRQVLANALRAWPTDERALQYHMLRGLGAFEKAYGGNYDVDRLVERMQDYLPGQMMMQALQESGLPGKPAAAQYLIPFLRKIYNKGLPTRSNSRLRPAVRRSEVA